MAILGKAPDDDPPIENLKADVQNGIKKLWKSIKVVHLKNLKLEQITNKKCVEAIADTCADSELPFSCEYDLFETFKIVLRIFFLEIWNVLA